MTVAGHCHQGGKRLRAASPPCWCQGIRKISRLDGSNSSVHFSTRTWEVNLSHFWDHRPIGARTSSSHLWSSSAISSGNDVLTYSNVSDSQATLPPGKPKRDKSHQVYESQETH
jgi:hypothetical protein